MIESRHARHQSLSQRSAGASPPARQARRLSLDAARFEALERERKDIQTRTQDLQAKRNALSKQIGAAKGKGEDASALLAEVAGIGDETKRLEGELDRVQARAARLPARPAEPHACSSVPVGKSSDDNVEVRRWGTPRAFDFPVADHTDIGEGLGLLDFATAAKLSGARFSFLRGGLARLHRALAQFMLDMQTREHGYTECYTPYIVNAETLVGTTQLPKFEADMFAVKKGGAEGEGEPLYLISTAEITLTNSVRDEILAGRSAADQAHRAHAVLPLGGGQLRQGHARHDPPAPVRQGRDGADRASRPLVRGARGADRPRRGDPAAAGAAVPRRGAVHRRHRLRRAPRPTTSRCGCPAQNAYREISSCSNCEAFQARRMQARFRNAQGKPELVHTLNGSGLAVGRTLVAVLENYQRADGGIDVPGRAAALHGRPRGDRWRRADRAAPRARPAHSPRARRARDARQRMLPVWPSE